MCRLMICVSPPDESVCELMWGWVQQHESVWGHRGGSPSLYTHSMWRTWQLDQSSEVRWNLLNFVYSGARHCGMGLCWWCACYKHAQRRLCLTCCSFLQSFWSHPVTCVPLATFVCVFLTGVKVTHWEQKWHMSFSHMNNDSSYFINDIYFTNDQ